MISSGESMLDVAKQLKDRKAKRVIVCTTFGLFTDGLEKFDEFYEKEYIHKVITTNLNYKNPDILTRPYYLEADMSKYRQTEFNALSAFSFNKKEIITFSGYDFSFVFLCISSYCLYS